MFISQAFAQDATTVAAPAGVEAAVAQFLPLIAIFVIFYFLLIRPQQKKIKEHQVLLGALKKGDKVVTGGGIMGTVTQVADGDEASIEIASGVTVRVQKSTIVSVVK